jgi:hypothetical protein
VALILKMIFSLLDKDKDIFLWAMLITVPTTFIAERVKTCDLYLKEIQLESRLGTGYYEELFRGPPQRL